MNRKALVIFLVSLSLLLFEISIIRLFSVLVVSKLSFLSITIALFGVALGGLFSYLNFSQNQFSNDKIFQKLLFAYAISVLIFLFLAIYVPVGTTILPIFLVILAAFPFIIGNIVLTIIFKNNSDSINRLYFADLVGAGLGVLLAIFIMSFSSVINAILISAWLGLLTIIFIKTFSVWRRLSLAVAIFLLIFIGANHFFSILKLQYSKGHGLQGVEFSKWNSFSFIASENRSGHIDSMSELYSQNLPDNIGIWIDGDAYTSTLKFDGDFTKVDFLQHDLSAASYMYQKPGQALIIGPGGGRDVLTALWFKNKVKGVDINPIIVNDLLKNKYADYSGNLYQRADTEIIVAEGRSFINKDKSTYDFINIPLVDTWSSTASGNLMLVESNLYTLEAMQEYLRHLNNEGTLSIMRWELDGQRLIPLYFTAAKKIGITQPEKNVVVISNSDLNNYLFKKNPFTDQELKKITDFAKINNFTINYSPASGNQSGEYEQIFKALAAGDDLKEWQGKNLSLVYDDGPFYFFQTPIQKIFSNNSNHLDGGLGQAFIITLLLTLLILVLPFSKINDQKVLLKDKRVFLYTAYFATLGLAFILIEMSLIQKFVVYLEQPIYSYSVVLATLLLVAGLGSRFSVKLPRQKASTYYGAAVILLVLALSYKIFLPTILSQSIGLGIGLKILLSIAIVAPMSFIIGTFLPMAFYKVKVEGLDYSLAWFWAVNGAFSVLGSVAAVFLAITWNFYNVLIFGAALYILAASFILVGNKISLIKN